MQPQERHKYCLIDKLGGGGVGHVYKALAPSGVIVALKFLNGAAQGDEQSRRRFRREFDVARKLVHPHIVRYLDFGSHAGQPYIVMEHVEGVSLWHWVRRHGPMPEADVARVASQIGSALNAAHQRNILHRDVQPNNVLLTQAGDAKLTDFGLVKDLEATDHLTADRAILGTPHFMAPEQFFDPKTVDCRADVYSLAATLIYALTGKIPFKFRGPGLLERKRAGHFLPPVDSGHNIASGIMSAIAAGLHPEPARRPQSTLRLAESVAAAAQTSASLSPRRVIPGGVERRALLRRPCDLAGISSFAGGACQNPVRITDISTEGLCLVSERMLSPQLVLNLSVCFGDADDCWDYQARVVNAGQWQGAQWRHGCGFLQPMDNAELLAVLNEPRGNVRVHVSTSLQEMGVNS